MRMMLADKGRFAPPPVLRSPLQAVSAAVQSWPGVISATHWHYADSNAVDGSDFYRGHDELGHIHVDGEVHLATSPSIARALIERGLATRFRWPGAEWAMFFIRSERDARHAEWLFRLGYDHLGGASDASLVAAMDERVVAA